MGKLYDEENDYVNEEHINAFARALVWDDQEDAETSHSGNYSTGYNLPSYEDAKKTASALDLTDFDAAVAQLSPVSLNTQESSAHSKERPAKIVSKSDWFPVVGSRKKKQRKPSTTEKLTNEFRILASYTFFRWPALILIFAWISFLCVIYIVVRAYVALLEFLFTWTGERKRLRDKLRQSKDYAEWVENAIKLDKYLGLDKWSDNPKFSYYDYRTIQKTVKRLRALRENGDIPELMVFLQSCLKKNFAGIENRQLYSHRYYGTKKLVEQYVTEVTKCINCVTDAPDLLVPLKQKSRFFKTVSKNYGKTALCLSGGACFAYTHFGIVKALLDNDLLPLIISGTSGGGIIASLACTRSDEELRKLLVPELARKITACEDPWYVWFPRFLKTGARFDAVAWAKKAAFFTKGSTTFQEAYKATGRKLNISTIPAEPHSPVILCNTVTSPNCIIWSSLLASSAVPGILNPVVLMMKETRTGDVVPFSMGNKWRDGSLRTDIPLDALNTYYNVNFLIVSQVNPHISLFFYAPKGTVGRPVTVSRKRTRKQKYAAFRGGFFATASEQLLKLEIKKWFQIIKLLDLLPRLLKQDWLNVFLQRFTGSITIWPRYRLKDFFYILLDPDEAKMEEFLLKGQRSMFPRLLFIRHRLSIERAIERGKKSIRATTMAIKNVQAMSRLPSASLATSDDGKKAHMELSDGAIEHLLSSSDEELNRTTISPFDQIFNEETEESNSSDDSGEDIDDNDEEIGDSFEEKGEGEIDLADRESIEDKINGDAADLSEDEDLKLSHRRNTIF